MSRLILDMGAVRHNLVAVDRIVRGHGASWTLVTKVLSGWPEAMRVLVESGIDSIADSRLENLSRAGLARRPGEVWYLRPPGPTDLAAVVEQTDISLNSDLSVVEAISAEAVRTGRVHPVLVMVELGDLREGVPPRNLAHFLERSGDLSGIRVLGVGSNLGCLTGAVPTVDQFSRLVMYRDLMRLKFGLELPLMSAGTSAVLPLALSGGLPGEVNHFRIGEAVFLGTDLIGGGTLAGLRDDALLLEAEVVEVRQKESGGGGEIADMGPFEHFPVDKPESGGGTRAVVAVGQLDTAVQGLACVEPGHRLAGASSDLAVVSIAEGSAPCRVGDWIGFRPSYGALVRLTSSPYVDLRVTGVPDEVSGDPWPSLRPVVGSG